MTQDQLAHTIFPLGEYETKEQVRELAEEYDFVNARKPDSQDICFVVNGKYGDFIEQQTGKHYPHGSFVDEEGHVLGEHKGLIRYTIGQRKGLGLALPHPMYVKAKDMEKNEVILAGDKGLYSDRLTADDFNWIWWPGCGKQENGQKTEAEAAQSESAQSEAAQSEAPQSEAAQSEATQIEAAKRQAEETTAPAPGTVIRATAKPRYRAREAAGTAAVNEDGSVSFVFDEPQRALTTGQALVLYDGDRVIGGGTIVSALR